jgi:hypothetical protein
MLVEKEVIRPGTYFYKDEKTGLPRKLVVTPELTKYWHDQGNSMIGLGLTVPVPYEHDFSAHPMTPKEQLLNNAGEVKQYSLKGDTLFSTVDVQDPDVKSKIGRSIRWTSPWINSFTDGSGKEWRNVISHLALTTRPRVTKQEAFSSIAAALSMATPIEYNLDKDAWKTFSGDKGLCLSTAGRLFEGVKTKRLRPRYPMAFSLWGGGIRLSDDDIPPKKSKDKPKPKPGESATPDAEPEDEFDGDLPETEKKGGSKGKDGNAPPSMDGEDGLTNPLGDAHGDVKMEELLCDLLQALGVPMPDVSNEHQFRRHLYEAVMCKIKELTSKGMGNADQTPDQNKPSTQQPNASQSNPLIGQVQQEQQPMYMSLEDINKLPDPMKGVALAMYAENQKLRGELDANKKSTDSLRDAKLKDENAKRLGRIALIGKLSPKVKADLDAMLALPSMALSMGDGGTVVDPMAQTLAILEKGLGDIPVLLRTDQSALSLAPQPTDATMLDDKTTDEIADGFARQMGCAPQAKKAS